MPDFSINPLDSNVFREDSDLSCSVLTLVEKRAPLRSMRSLPIGPRTRCQIEVGLVPVEEAVQFVDHEFKEMRVLIAGAPTTPSAPAARGRTRPAPAGGPEVLARMGPAGYRDPRARRTKPKAKPIQTLCIVRVWADEDFRHRDRAPLASPFN